ncbi:MAG: 50S ribosomal protein L10 [Armatimonadetes bacterium]|nr:50S ribosomal protein L10 [Armatimonadota bacterium]
MATPKKEQAVAELTALVQESSSVVLADYRGLTMKDFNELRARLRPEQVEFHVVKNTLLRRASSGTALSELAEALEGPTAIAVSLGDSVAGPRLLNQYIRDSRSPMTIKSGVVDGTAYDGGAIEQIAKLPPRDQMIAQVLGGLQAPIANLAGTLQTMLGSLVWTLTGIAEQKA